MLMELGTGLRRAAVRRRWSAAEQATAARRGPEVARQAAEGAIPETAPDVEREPPRFSAEELDIDLLIDEYYAMEDRILRTWIAALEGFQVLANSPAGAQTNPDLTGAVMNFAVDEVLGALSKPTAAMKSLLDDAAAAVEKAKEAETTKSIADFFAGYHATFTTLRNLLEGGRNDRRGGKNHWKQHVRNLMETAFGSTERPPEGAIWSYGGENAEEARRAHDEYVELRSYFEALHRDARARARGASYSRYFLFLVENWLRHNKTRVWPGVEQDAQLSIHVNRDFTVRKATLRAPRAEQLAQGFGVIAEAIRQVDPGAGGVDLWDMNVQQRIFYYGREPGERHARFATHVIVIRSNGMVSGGESWGPEWGEILARLRRERPRIGTVQDEGG